MSLALASALTHAAVTAAGPAPALLPDWMDPNTLITNFINNFGTAAVIGVAIIVFIETGLFFPILPGDSLLFMAGAFAGTGNGQLGIPLPVLCLIMMLAAFLGDQNAYWIGRVVGPKLFKPDSRVFKKKYIDKTHEYFEKYGGRTIVIARFVPIVRTFSAVSAGVSHMSYRTFVTYDAIGAILWGGGVTILGHFLGNIAFVKDNIEVLLVLIVLISVVPMAVEVLKARRAAKNQPPAETVIDVVAGEGLGVSESELAAFEAQVDEGSPAADTDGTATGLRATPYLGRFDRAAEGNETGPYPHRAAPRDIVGVDLPPRHVREP